MKLPDKVYVPGRTNDEGFRPLAVSDAKTRSTGVLAGATADIVAEALLWHTTKKNRKALLESGERFAVAELASGDELSEACEVVGAEQIVYYESNPREDSSGCFFIDVQNKCLACGGLIGADDPYIGVENYNTREEFHYHPELNCSQEASRHLERGTVLILHHYHTCGDPNPGWNCGGGCFSDEGGE